MAPSRLPIAPPPAFKPLSPPNRLGQPCCDGRELEQQHHRNHLQHDIGDDAHIDIAAGNFRWHQTWQPRRCRQTGNLTFSEVSSNGRHFMMPRLPQRRKRATGAFVEGASRSWSVGQVVSWSVGHWKFQIVCLVVGSERARNHFENQN